tara:strand:- start:4248 stop:4712 length:465 start_codon:yes stop_codon:yes gene_type:complete
MPSTTSSDSSSTKSFIILALIGLVIWNSYQCPQEEVSQGAFSQEITESVLPIREKLSSSPEKAKALALLYTQWADTIDRDQGNRIRTTALFRSAHSASLDIYLQKTGLQGEPTVGAEIDAAIISAIGDAVQVIDADLSKRLEEVFLAIAWACNE